MSITKLIVNNFRSIKNLELSLTPENKVICFVGENGSSKTALMTTLTEAIVSHSKLRFPNFSRDNGKRFRLLSKNEIQTGEKFYSIELDYKKLKGKNHTFKKLVVLDKTVDPLIYADVMSGMRLSDGADSEMSSVQKSHAEDDFLFDSVFLFRPGHRYENDGMLLDNEGDWDGNLSVARGLNLSIPHPFSVAYSGDGIQSIILDMYFDAQVGYTDSVAGFNNITNILNKVTGKDYGDIQISKSPYRQVISSTVGLLRDFSQGELDLLVTIANIIKQQVFFFELYTEEQRKTLSVNSLFYVPGIVLIDEVDLHLHPKAQENYLQVLTSIFPNIQFVVTTHSPFVIRGLPENSKVINLPSGRMFDENFEAMDIDSITEVIFGYEGGFSESVNVKFSQFKAELISERPNLDLLRALYEELSTSSSAKDELDLYLASYAQEELINSVKGS